MSKKLYLSNRNSVLKLEKNFTIIKIMKNYFKNNKNKNNRKLN